VTRNHSLNRTHCGMRQRPSISFWALATYRNGPVSSNVMPHMRPLRAHERLALDMLLAGEEHALVALRAQAQEVAVRSRTYSSFGEYVDLTAPANSQTASPSELILSDIELNVSGVSHAVTVMLYVKSGRLDFIEFSTIEGDWPEQPLVTSAHYLRAVPTGPQSFGLEPVQLRHPATLSRALAGRDQQSAA